MTANVRPPRLAAALLGWRLSAPEYESLLGDLAEGFDEKVHSHGAMRARLWYWREAATAVSTTRSTE